MFEKTGGYRIGTVMLGKDLSANFTDDLTRYQFLYEAGYRAFQVFLVGCTDEYLLALRTWADEKGDVELSGLLAFIEDGIDGACPISAATSKRESAKAQVVETFRKAKLVRATGIHGPLFQGLLNQHLNDIPSDVQRQYLIEFVRFVDELANEAKLPVGWEVLNMHENPPPGPTRLADAERIFVAAGASHRMRYLLDTCHQGQGERSTTDSWERFQSDASCIHFSDYGRSRLGMEQAISPKVFSYLVQAKLPVTIYVEAVGTDCNPFIQRALHVNHLGNATGDVVLKFAMNFIEEGFKNAA
jgi:hypothetical protein